MRKVKIKNQKTGNLSEADRLMLAQLLIKAGYTARLGKERKSEKAGVPYEHYVEFWEDGTVGL